MTLFTLAWIAIIGGGLFLVRALDRPKPMPDIPPAPRCPHGD